MNFLRNNILLSIGMALPLFGPPSAFANDPGHGDEMPALRFGVMSDVHMRKSRPQNAVFLENALRRFAAERVDAVLCLGDIAHSGMISELETFAGIWNRVFPDGRGMDGDKVELLLVTGNHDIDAWGGRWEGLSEEEQTAERFYYGDNPEKTWERLFGQKWETVWRREVKGYTFIGAQWQTTKPPIAKFIAEAAPTLDPGRPFFFLQHAPPRDTCHGFYSSGDEWPGEAKKALAPFPNAVAFSGHSHCALSDEKAIWQGEFTSIGAGCTHEPALLVDSPDYANCSQAFPRPEDAGKPMASLSNEVGGRDAGGGYLLVEVFRDRLVVRRLSVTFDEPIGPAWTVPFPARKKGPLDFARRAAEGIPPQFPPDATLAVEFHPDGHPFESAGHRGSPCVAVTFPHANNVGGHRVFDYEIQAEAKGRKTVLRRIMAPGFAFPERYADLPGACLFLASELPAGKVVRFTVTPRDCFGGRGRPIGGEWNMP